MDDLYHNVVTQLLAQVQPRTLLCLGAPCPSAVGDYVAAAPGRLAQHLAQPQPELGRYDLVLVADVLERLDKTAAVQLLARLRDRCGGRFLLALAADAPWQDDELLALGLVGCGRSAALRLYRYDLADYKTTPDWLNPRFWAHPERWDKDFW